jgi:hypothetical protein
MAVSERYRSRQAKIAGDRWAIFTHISFGLMLALVVARCTMSESVREPFQVMPGAHTGLHGAGPAGSMALDLFCCVPAILILLRRVLDKSYVLRWTWSQVLLLPLAIWMAMSVRRSDDEFGALIGVANFVAALAILWAAAQLVRSWLRLRLVAAVAFGLLMILLAQGVYYRAIELPDLQQTFEKNREQYLRDFGYTPGSFAARQFQRIDEFVRGGAVAAVDRRGGGGNPARCRSRRRWLGGGDWAGDGAGGDSAAGYEIEGGAGFADSRGGDAGGHLALARSAGQVFQAGVLGWSGDGGAGFRSRHRARALSSRSTDGEPEFSLAILGGLVADVLAASDRGDRVEQFRRALSARSIAGGGGGDSRSA